jgi:hypothetical protein
LSNVWEARERSKRVTAGFSTLRSTRAWPRTVTDTTSPSETAVNRLNGAEAADIGMDARAGRGPIPSSSPLRPIRLTIFVARLGATNGQPRPDALGPAFDAMLGAPAVRRFRRRDKNEPGCAFEMGREAPTLGEPTTRSTLARPLASA